MVGRFPAGSEILISILGRSVCDFGVLSYVVSGGDPDIVLTTHSGRPALVYLSSVLVHSVLLSLQASESRAFGCKTREGCKSYIGEDK